MSGPFQGKTTNLIIAHGSKFSGSVEGAEMGLSLLQCMAPSLFFVGVTEKGLLSTGPNMDFFEGSAWTCSQIASGSAAFSLADGILRPVADTNQ